MLELFENGFKGIETEMVFNTFYLLVGIFLYLATLRLGFKRFPTLEFRQNLLAERTKFMKALVAIGTLLGMLVPNYFMLVFLGLLFPITPLWAITLIIFSPIYCVFRLIFDNTPLWESFQKDINKMD